MSIKYNIQNIFGSVFLFLFFFASKAFPFDGPLQIKNQYPIFLHVCPPYLEKASTEDSLSFSLSHSSTYTLQGADNWAVNLDMEITEVNFRYRRTLKEGIELGIDIPLFVLSKGFMDGFLEVYHNTFGFPDYGRSKRPSNSFLYEVRKDGGLVIKGEEQINIGDIRFAIKKSLISLGEFEWSIKGELELPTGDVKKGFGNGSVDVGVSMLFDKSISEDTMIYWNFGMVFPGDLIGYQRVDLKNFFYSGVAMETLVGKGFSIILQFYGQSPVYPKTGISAVDRPALILSIGSRYYSGNRSFEVSLTEDLNTSGAPDFILNFTYKIRP